MRRARLLLPILLLAGCEGLDSAPAIALRDAVRPEHMAYVDADTTLDAAQKARRLRTWQAYDAWIAAIEESR